MILQGDALTMLKTLDAESVDCCITSPPYYALRDYGMPDQIGLEKTAEEYVWRLVEVFDEVSRVLKKTGTLWVNIGDTYYGGRNKGNKNPKVKSKQVRGLHNLGDSVPGPHGQSKSLAQIPSRFALAMASRGWILRNEIIWHKPNAMPQSVKDRFTVDYEKLYFFTKSPKYYFKQQCEPYAPASDVRYRQALRAGRSYVTKEPYKKNTLYSGYKRGQGAVASRGNDGDGLVVGGFNPNGRNMRSVWAINTKPFDGAHFAVFPPELVEMPIKAGCPEGGVVLDPFAGSGTTIEVAVRMGRKWIGIELNPQYIEIINNRLRGVPTPLPI